MRWRAEIRRRRQLASFGGGQDGGAPSNVHLGLDSFKRSIEIPQEISLSSATLFLGTSFMCHWSHFFWPLRRPIIELHFIVDPQQ
jgi:hypothetical protein